MEQFINQKLNIPFLSQTVIPRIKADPGVPAGLQGNDSGTQNISFGHLKDRTSTGLSLLRAPEDNKLGDRAIITDKGILGKNLFING